MFPYQYSIPLNSFFFFCPPPHSPAAPPQHVEFLGQGLDLNSSQDLCSCRNTRSLTHGPGQGLTLHPNAPKTPLIPLHDSSNSYSLKFLTSIFFGLFVCFWPCLWHAEVPGPGIKPMPQQQPEPLQ